MEQHLGAGRSSRQPACGLLHSRQVSKLFRQTWILVLCLLVSPLPHVMVDIFEHDRSDHDSSDYDSSEHDSSEHDISASAMKAQSEGASLHANTKLSDGAATSSLVANGGDGCGDDCRTASECAASCHCLGCHASRHRAHSEVHLARRELTLPLKAGGEFSLCRALADQTQPSDLYRPPRA